MSKSPKQEPLRLKAECIPSRRDQQLRQADIYLDDISYITPDLGTAFGEIPGSIIHIHDTLIGNQGSSYRGIHNFNSISAVFFGNLPENLHTFHPALMQDEEDHFTIPAWLNLDSVTGPYLESFNTPDTQPTILYPDSYNARPAFQLVSNLKDPNSIIMLEEYAEICNRRDLSIGFTSPAQP